MLKVFTNLNNSFVLKYNTVEAMRKRFQKSVPNFVYQYIESGTGNELALEENRRSFNRIKFIPKFCLKAGVPDLKVDIFGYTFNSPLGMAPIGMAGIVRPEAEVTLAKIAKEVNIPFTLSTVATCTPESIAQKTNVGSENKWFQLYAPKDKDVLDSLLSRAKNAGFKTLVVTVDIPAPSRRERSQNAGIRIPLKLTPKLFFDSICRPLWSLRILTQGIPKLKTVEKYSENNSLKFTSKFVGNRLGGSLDWHYVSELRRLWKGNLILKGIVHPEDALLAKEFGCDAVYVSNHGGRQFDGVVSSLNQLEQIRRVLGKDYPIIFDSGVRTGLDVLKAIHAGADLVMIGRPFLYGVGAYGYLGGKQIHNIIEDQLRNNMMQLGLENIEDIKNIQEDQIAR